MWISDAGRRDEGSGRIRVLTLTDHFGPVGGAENVAFELALRLDPARFESTLCATRWSPSESQAPGVADALDALSAAGVRVIALERRAKLDLLPWLELGRWVRRERIDVLHAHSFGSNVWGASLGGILRVPAIIAHEHTWSFEGARLRRFLDRNLVARLSDAFVAVSREDSRKLTEVVGVPARMVRYIPNGIETRPAGAGADVRAEFSIPADAPVIVSVGNLRAQKAYDNLIRAVRRVRARHPDLRVLIAGRPMGEERALDHLLSTSLLHDVVRFVGPRDDVPDLLAAATMAVLASDYEGMPLSVLEYMSAGLPVVATSVGGVPDLIEDGVHGRLVPRRDPEALAGAILELLADPARASSMGARGRVRAREEFAVETMVRRCESLYLEHAGEGQASEAAERRLRLASVA